MNEVNKLANALALQAAKKILLITTNPFDCDGFEWRNVDIDLRGQPLGSALKKELRYLTLRKALIWHPTKPNLVRIVEVPE